MVPCDDTESRPRPIYQHSNMSTHTICLSYADGQLRDCFTNYIIYSRLAVAEYTSISIGQWWHWLNVIFFLHWAIPHICLCCWPPTLLGWYSLKGMSTFGILSMHRMNKNTHCRVDSKFWIDSAIITGLLKSPCRCASRSLISAKSLFWGSHSIITPTSKSL